MIIRGARPENGWTILHNRVLSDARLSFGALGLLGYLLSKPDDWKIQVAELVRQKRKKGGRAAIYTLLGELVEAGYATIERRRGDTGTWVSDWTIYDAPPVSKIDTGPVSKIDTGDRCRKSTRVLKTEEEPKTPPVSPPLSMFDQIREAYPKRGGNQPWGKARMALTARLREHPDDAWAILDGLDRYTKFCEATRKVGTELVMQAATFLGPDRPYLQDWAIPATVGTTTHERNIAYLKGAPEE